MSTPAAASENVAALYPVFQQLPAELGAQCLAEAQAMTVPAGTVVFDAGQPCQGFPLVMKGSIRVIKPSESGRELPLYRVTPGESCLITSGCLLGRNDYNARGVTESETTLLLLPTRRFNELLAQPAFRDFIFHLLAERMADLMQLVEEVAFRKLDQRLAGLLLGKGRLLHTTHQQLADELGSVREMISRLLKGFAEQGWVRLGREQIEILDPAALRQLAG